MSVSDRDAVHYALSNKGDLMITNLRWNDFLWMMFYSSSETWVIVHMEGHGVRVYEREYFCLDDDNEASSRNRIVYQNAVHTYEDVVIVDLAFVLTTMWGKGIVEERIMI